ncbi:hypothetical protein [Clostridium sp. HBUAS56010]|uniref:hypothetical protein n=1 Tax=Clostridium sp. HBUAS56010 TaxID=2571127 RepID=UPI0011787193|nr:hypothetical protein [Clostridium sp. HBUAS56010]
MGQSEDNFVIIPNGSNRSSISDGETGIKSDSEVFLITDKKLKKDLVKYINQLHGRRWPWEY